MEQRDELLNRNISSNQNDVDKAQKENLFIEHETIKECFHSLISEFIVQSPRIKGALIAFDPNGHLIESYKFSEIEEETFSELIKFASCHESKRLQQFDSFAVPIFSSSDQLITTLGLLVHKDHINQDSTFLLKSIEIAFKACLRMNIERKLNRKLTNFHQKSQKESQKRDMLFQAVKRLHSKTDVDSVLAEVFDSLKWIFPCIEIELFLSQDNHSTKLLVKPLVFDDLEEDLCTRAFMEGKTLCQTQEDGKSSIAAPLCGKQGVYGVFLLNFQNKQYDDEDLKFITLLSDSAGTAFENAKLYEHSNLLISELRLINEITRRLNQSLKLQDIFNYASKELIEIFHADYGCILKLEAKEEKLVVQASNLAGLVDEFFSLDYGFSGIVYKTKEPVIVSDYSSNHSVESKLMNMTKSRSLIAAPILVSSNVVGVLLVTHREPNFFSYENYKLLQVISVHIGMAITNASLHAEVRRMVITDNLTGLNVRSYLDDKVNEMQKKDVCGALILADIDYFKKINDTYGHQVGDKVLIQVSQIIRSSIRDSDIAARWGGEELAVYLPQSTLDQTLRVAERIRLSVFNETDPQVSVSCGISQWNWEDDNISVESLFYDADMALYEAKNTGRNIVIVG